MDKEQFASKRRWARPCRPSMKRRRVGHDYSGRCIYMITLVVDGRRPLLARVSGNGEDDPAVVHPTALGRAVLDQLGEIPRHYPMARVISQQLMPDHLHIILYVQDRLPCHLSQVVNGYKGGCTTVYRALLPQQAAAVGRLWETGYHDRILHGPGHLQRMMDYLDDNPRRLAIKRHHPDYFVVQRSVQAGGSTFAALGNLFLLQAPLLLQVQCTRRLTDDQIAATVDRFLAACEDGAVLVSPSISPGERAVMRAAFDAGYPTIILQENGFAPLAKPGGRRFEACAAGRLLLLAPWEHHNQRVTIRRDQCLDLNAMAAALCRR